MQRMQSNKEQEKEAFVICQDKIAAHNLPMKLINVECTFDLSKIIFYFTADGRVDFRELVKDLAAVFRTRIELRQVGVRDQAKLLGGIGCCGRPLCCASFLGDFAPVSIRMAKGQNLSLNPTKISGICGRLMCCLRFEDDDEECPCQNCRHEKVQPPRQGSRVVTDDGEGKVISINMGRRSCTILLDNRKTVVVGFEDAVEIEEDVIANYSADKSDDYKNVDEIIAYPFADTENEKKQRPRERRIAPHENTMPPVNHRRDGKLNNRPQPPRNFSNRRRNRDND